MTWSINPLNDEANLFPSTDTIRRCLFRSRVRREGPSAWHHNHWPAGRVTWAAGHRIQARSRQNHRSWMAKISNGFTSGHVDANTSWEIGWDNRGVSRRPSLIALDSSIRAGSGLDGSARTNSAFYATGSEVVATQHVWPLDT